MRPRTVVALDREINMASIARRVTMLDMGFGQLLGVKSIGKPWRAVAAGLAFVTMFAAVPGPPGEHGARAATARRDAAPDDSARDRQARAVTDSFDGLDTATALIDQRGRIEQAMRALPPHPNSPETFILSIGGNGFQAIFDREAQQAATVLAARTPGPALVLSNTAAQVRAGLLASPRTVDLAVAAIGRRARPGDTIDVYLASHGGRDAAISMDAPGLDFADLTSRRLADDLARSGLNRRIVIVSACFGASWIPALATPATIVIAAARADRSSFGCDDSRQLTVFGEAITSELTHRERSLATVFARTRERVAAVERTGGDIPSLPQATVGSSMTSVWTQTPYAIRTGAVQ